VKNLFSLLVGQPALYYSLALSVLFAFAGMAVAGTKALGEKRKLEWCFLILAGSTFVIWRLPILLWPQPLNIDEGHWAACAIKATYDFAPWRGFDATTSGPLNADVLVLPAIFGAPITFFSTRLIGCGLVIAAIYAFYFITKWTHGTDTARLALVPPVGFLALTWEWDFLHYSSEELPIFLTTFGVAAGAYLLIGTRDRSRIAACLVGGLTLGAASFAKLQVIPVALTGAVFIAAMIYFTNGHWKQRRRELIFLGLGLAAVPAAIALSLTVTNEWDDAIISYINSAVVHVTSGATVGFDFFFGDTVTFSVFASCALALIAIGAVALRSRWSFSTRSTAVALWAGIFLIVSLVAIVTPRHAYPHYLLFSVLPLSYGLAVVFEFTRQAGLWKNRQTVLSALVAAIFVVPGLSAALAHPSPHLGDVRDLLTRIPGAYGNPLPLQNTAAQIQAIRRYAQPHTRISIWGWMPHYYVQTQTIMATRDAHTKPQLTPGPYQKYFRDRYLGDLRANPPKVFVDAVAPGAFAYNQRAADGFETFPALAAFIGEKYRLAEEVDGVRVFVLKKGAYSTPE
jgi:hypothetical protein